MIFLNDGPIPEDRLQVMEKSGEVLARSKLGARGSMRAALDIPVVRAWPHRPLVWFAEDDYLYQPCALNDLIAAAAAYPDTWSFCALCRDSLAAAKRRPIRRPRPGQMA